jgi:hypothetical protein
VAVAEFASADGIDEMKQERGERKRKYALSDGD